MHRKLIVRARVETSLFVITSLVAIAGCGGGSNTMTTTNLGTITTVAGTGQFGYSGDGGLATAAKLYEPTCAVIDSKGNLFIGDVGSYTVRKVAAGTGIITHYAGIGLPGYTGDGGQAASAKLYGPAGCVLDANDNLYLADVGNNVVRKIDSSSGVITTVAGTGYGAGAGGIGGFSGDGGLATKAELFQPNGVAVDAAGSIYISDTSNQRVRVVDGKTGIITTIAGNGTYGYTGNQGPAISAEIANPEQLALDGSGHLYIAEQGKSVVTRVDLSSGTITTVAGNGTEGEGSGTTTPDVNGDGGLATKAQLGLPQGVALDRAGNLFIADSDNQRVRMVSAATGIITTVVGTTVGYSGDGGASDRAQVHNPEGLFFDSSGNLYLADSFNSAVRKVTPQQ